MWTPCFFPPPKRCTRKDFKPTSTWRRSPTNCAVKAVATFFRGVTTLVLKLFNIVNPYSAFFGEKDRQQLEVIRKMVDDLNLDIEDCWPADHPGTGRTGHEFAQSISGKAERETAKSLNKALQQAQQLISQGESSAETIRSRMRTIIEREGQAQVDYISVCDPKRFEELEEIQGKNDDRPGRSCRESPAH